MDKKKLIGTIIGVTLFVVLVAGATFAWLTFSATITNGNYVYQTKNFVINYERGDQSLGGNLPSLTTATAATATETVVSAFRDAGTPNGILYLKVTSSDSNITKGGAVRYAVCSGTESESDCTGNLLSGETGVLSTGSITNVGETIMYQTADPDLNEAGEGVGIPTVKTYYWIYFWMNPSNLTNAMISETYEGYVHASAEQR
ncbi:MAG: hypothetical protein IJE89_00580 [Bacilli bacterium]|nr:hypothetical protein [Bacilli bacterium]